MEGGKGAFKNPQGASSTELNEPAHCAFAHWLQEPDAAPLGAGGGAEEVGGGAGTGRKDYERQGCGKREGAATAGKKSVPLCLAC